MLANSPKTYGLIAQALHWAVAVLILTLIPLGVYMHELPAGSAEEAAFKSWFYSLHKTLGITVLGLAVIRVGWAALQPHPRPLHADRRWETMAAQAVHWILYGAIIAMPLSGWLHHSALEGFAPIWWPLPQDLPLVPKNLQLADLFGTIHYLTAILLGISLVLHIGGALKHALIDRDATLARMIPFRAVDLAANLDEPQHRYSPIALAILAFAVVGGLAFVTFNAGGPDQSVARETRAVEGETSSGWLVDPQQSRLDIEFVQSGSPVSGRFGNWNAVIDFDPDNLEAARVSVEVDVASLTLGGVSEQALSEAFLNAAEHPVATFVSDDFAETGPGAYEARGQLRLAGAAGAVTLPFSLKIDGDRAYVDGRLTLNRLDFDIGRDGFSTDQMIGFGVDVSVILEAVKTAEN